MASETSPLLQASEDRSPGDEERSPLAEEANATDNEPSRLSRFRQIISDHLQLWTPIYLCLLFLLFLEFPGELSAAPNLRMIELAVCRRYYEERGNLGDQWGNEGYLTDDLCDIDEVQTQVAKILAILGPLDTIPGLLLAIPYGVLADLKGRKFVLALCLFGIICSSIWGRVVLSPTPFLPLWVIYTVPLWQIIGGGAVVLTNLILAIIADVVPSEIRFASLRLFCLYVTDLAS